jgi:cell wall-associated NlpC family hydrolase
LYLDNFAAEGFRKIPVEEVQRGDLILMNLVSPLPNHAAIYMGDQQVLHHVQGRLSSRDVYTLGSSYYGKSTACALRHENR